MPTVSRGSETFFDQIFIGDQSYRFNQTLQLQAGDILSIEHAEAKTRYTTNDDATMNTSAMKSQPVICTSSTHSTIFTVRFIKVNSTNPTVAIDQTSAASTSNRPANQVTANQQLPQTGNQNSALLGLGLSALAAMLGIGGKRLKRD